MTNHFEHNEQFDPKGIIEKIDETLAEINTLLLESRFPVRRRKRNVFAKTVWFVGCNERQSGS